MLFVAVYQLNSQAEIELCTWKQRDGLAFLVLPMPETLPIVFQFTSLISAVLIRFCLK